MNLRIQYLVTGWLLLATLPLRADHLVGGDLSMTYLGKPGQFRLTMKQYWNESNNTGDYANDAQQDVYVFSRRNSTFMNSIILRQVSKRPVVYQNPACAKANRLQTVEVRFETTFQFDSRYADADGYYMVWERCCRNGSLINIKNPAQTGFVLYLQFQATATGNTNSSPEFTLAAGDYVCLNQPTQLDFSANDPDGNQLTYQLVTPWAGYTTPDQNRGTVISRSSYPPIRWQTGFSDNIVIPGPAPLRIDAKTGLLSLTPGQTGLFAFAVEVTELDHGGRVIGVARREFQLLVTDCSTTALDPPVILRNGQPVQVATLCPNDSVTLAVPPSTAYQYQWQRDKTNLTNATTATLTTRLPGLYTVVKSATSTCARDTVSDAVALRLSPTVVRFDSVPPLCDPGAGAVTLIATPPNGQFTGTGVTGQTFAPSRAGVGAHSVQYTYTDSSGCRFSQTRTVVVQPPVQLRVPNTLSIRRGDTVRLAASANVALAAVRWSPPTGLSDAQSLRPLASPAESQTYELTVSTAGGCTATAGVTVNVLSGLSIPDAFSPNGDGLNDTWELRGIKAYKTPEVTIFDRWGSVVFHTLGYEQPWDGTIRGEPAGRGVYGYQIRLNDGQISYRGSLTVLP